MKNTALIFFLLLSLTVFLQAQSTGEDTRRPGPVTGGTDIPALNAAEEFRIGVQAYYRYAYNESILSFERALSFRPGEPIILDWLGKAYYRSGFEDTAIRQWRAALDTYGRNTGTGMLLGARIETVLNRRFLLPIANDEVRFVEAGRYPGRFGDIVLFSQPTAVLPVEDGSVWVVAYGSNEIVRIDVNGVVRERKRGPLNGFDRPYDLVRGIDGRLYLSEYRGGRVSILNSRGDWQSYIGSKGLGDGMFVGPQNLAVDEDGYLYVVDYGNGRISKFSPDGELILSFGQRREGFSGFLSPTGIAAGHGRVFISDSVSKQIYIFDPNGHYLGILAIEGLRGPESMRFLSDGRLLLADTNRVLLIDTASAIVRELGLAGNERVRIVGADMDRNGSILAANFTAGEISILTRFDDLASGFFVQIRRVSAERFPLVTVELEVEDRLRRPIVGLDANNFLLSEGGRAVSEQNFLQPGHRYPGADISILVERSEKTANIQNDLAAAVRDINRALGEMGNSRIVSFVSAGVQPQRERYENALDTAARAAPASYSPRWRLDLGLRLAATDLLSAAPKRSVVFIGSGNLGELAFEQYSLSELAAYLANNGIVFNAVITGAEPVSQEIRYLCAETGGTAMYLYRPQGIAQMIKNIQNTPNGTYNISFRSLLPTDFGRAWLPLEAEVYLMERSGRDNVGYYPPLE